MVTNYRFFVTVQTRQPLKTGRIWYNLSVFYINIGLPLSMDVTAWYKFMLFFAYVDKQLFVTAYILAPSTLLNLPVFVLS